MKICYTLLIIIRRFWNKSQITNQLLISFGFNWLCYPLLQYNFSWLNNLLKVRVRNSCLWFCWKYSWKYICYLDILEIFTLPKTESKSSVFLQDVQHLTTLTLIVSLCMRNFLEVELDEGGMLSHHSHLTLPRLSCYLWGY